MVHEMYKQYARPLARVVHGLSDSWEPIVATAYHEDFDSVAAWSPCSRFVAVAKFGGVEIRDGVTLSPLNTFGSPDSQALWLRFSPDSRFLTQFNRKDLITWDVQTGASVRAIFPEGLSVDRFNFSSTHSMDRKLLAVVYLYKPQRKTFIATHSLSTPRTHLYHISEGRILSPIWTHGEVLRFATVKPGIITIWEAEFTLTHSPEVVETLPAPDEITDTEAIEVSLFLPALSRLATIIDKRVLVWDAKRSELLLDISPYRACGMSFSDDGRFFASFSKDERRAHVLKETPDGYTLHQYLSFFTFDDNAVPLLSPHGESTIIPFGSKVHVWHTKDVITSNSGRHRRNFILAFSTNETSVSFLRKWGNEVMVLDLQSGDPQMKIVTGMRVVCLRATESTIVVCGRGKIAAWDLTTGNKWASISDSVWTSPFGESFNSASISPDLSHIVTSGQNKLSTYDASTGRCLAAVAADSDLGSEELWFTTDGREVWSVSYREPDFPRGRWRITEIGETGTTKLEPLGVTACPPGTLPWLSPRGYEITDDGWVLSPAQKRLLWLPHLWRSDDTNRTWAGRFLGLGHRELPKVVIIEFFQ